jgi:hypothetical protein
LAGQTKLPPSPLSIAFQVLPALNRLALPEYPDVDS